MKIAVVMQDTRALYGAERATVELVRGLREAGVDVRAWLLEEARLAAGRRAASPLAAALAALAPVRTFPVEGRLSKSLAAALRAAVAEDGIDILHSTGYKADVHVAMARGEPGTDNAAPFAIVSSVHGWLFRRFAFKENLYFRVNLAALRRFDRVIVLSSFYERLLIRHGLLPLQLALIPSAVDPDALAPAGARAELAAQSPSLAIDSPPLTFGLLGRLSEEKNHALALRAARILDRLADTSPRPWRMFIAGDGPLRPRLERLARRLGLADRVTFAGILPSAEFFPKIHVLLQPSKIENRPMALLEAAAWERPTIATAVGGMPEMVEDGVTGRLVRPGFGAARRIALAMFDYWKNPPLAHRHGLAARQCLDAAPPPAARIAETLQVYRAAMR